MKVYGGVINWLSAFVNELHLYSIIFINILMMIMWTLGATIPGTESQIQ